MREGLQPGDPERIGPYRVIGCLGEGGMGRVFLCLSPVGRKVAVKVIRQDQAADPVFLERFRREVDAARRVDGLHTACVVEADLDGPVLWLATAYGGPSLADVVRDRGPLPAASLLALAAGLSDGLAAIHRNGIVHRDLKPSNVLLAEDGPRVIDFGISRAAGDSGLTDFGKVMGTPRFMSPEQVCGRNVGPPSDVFSLGSVLAFAATGHPPFGEDSAQDVTRRIRDEPPRLDGVPAEIRDLVRRCLAKNPRKRPTPDDLVASLGDGHLTEGWLPAGFLAGSPRQAPAGEASSAATVRVRRNRARPDGRGRTLLYSAPPFGRDVSWPRAGRLIRRRFSRLAGSRPRIVLAGAGAALVALLATAATVLAAGQGPGPFRPQLGRALSYPRSLGLTSVTFSPDGRLLAVADSGGTTRVWTAGSGRLTVTLRDPGQAGVADVAFGPDGGLLAAADGNGNTYLWRLATGSIAATLPDPGSPGVTGAAFGPDGSLLAAADDNGNAYLWRVATGTLIGTFSDPGRGRLTSVAFSPDGSLLAAADENGGGYLWRTATGKLIGTFSDPGGGVADDVAFSPDGSMLATADSNGSTYLWTVATRRLAATLRDPGSGGVARVAFSPHGYLLAAADDNGASYVWTVATRRLAGTLRDPGPGGGGVAGVAFSPDGSMLAVAYINGHIYLWRTGSAGF